jgi:uncharacterized membrane protein YdjX (TVP38/TMEM64 family)
LGVAILAAVAFALPLHAIPAAVSHLGPLAPVAGVTVGAALLIALVPRTPISLACGLLFGAATGALCALLVALVAATVTFAAGRWLGRDFVRRRAGRHWHRLEGWIEREGALAVAAVRALPLGPYGLSGYAYGASGVPVRAYAIGTFVAAVPSAVSYALLGAAVASSRGMSLLSVLPLGIGLLFSAALVVRARRVASRRDYYAGESS